MKIFLIQPKGESVFFVPPLGLQVIAAVLKQNNFKNIIDIDPNKGDDPYALDYSGEKTIVGLSVTFMTLIESFRLAAHIKSNNPGALVVLGGSQATLVPEEVISNEHVDAVAIGEGIMTMLDLAERVQNDYSLIGVRGLWLKDNEGRIIRNEPREFLTDLDSIPYQDRSFFNETEYYKGVKQLFMKMVGVSWNVMSAQSCPYNCRMCQPALRKIAGPWRQRSVMHVIDEIKLLKEKYNARLFNFHDNDMGIDRRWMKDFCAEAGEIDGISMTCCGRANLLDYEMLKMMKEAGFDSISFGAESGSDRVLKEIMNKKITVRNIIDMANNCYELGVRANAFWMLASPGETLEEMQETIQLSSSLPLFYSHFHIANPNPGTHYYLDAVSGGYLNMDSWDDVNDRSNPCIIKDNVSVEEIRKIDELLVETMIARGWNCHSNGHTLSFHNTRVFLKHEPIRVIGREVLNYLTDRKSYHLRNLYLGAKGCFKN